MVRSGHTQVQDRQRQQRWPATTDLEHVNEVEQPDAEAHPTCSSAPQHKVGRRVHGGNGDKGLLGVGALVPGKRYDEHRTDDQEKACVGCMPRYDRRLILREVEQDQSADTEDNPIAVQAMPQSEFIARLIFIGCEMADVYAPGSITTPSCVALRA